MFDLSALTDPALTVLVSVAATWGAMRSKVVALGEAKKASDKEIEELKERVTRLEERHDGLVSRIDEAVRSLERKIDGAVSNLERVTEKLETLAIKIASGGK